MVICMNLKKKLLTLIICSFIVIFTASCSCGGGAEEVKNDATVAAQAETNEKGETVTNAQTQAEAKQDDGTVNDDDNTKEENSSNKSSDNNNDKNNNSENSDNSKSEKPDSTENKSDDDKTANDVEDPLYNAEAVFDEDDFEF